MTKTHWKISFDSPYLGSWDLEDYKDVTLTIEKAVSEKTKKLKENSIKNIIYFKEAGFKPMIINAGNSKMITKLSKSPYLDDWAGTRITICVKSVRAFGEDHDALRVREKTAELPELTKDNKNFKAIKEGNFTIEQIKRKYTLSPETEKLLTK